MNDLLDGILATLAFAGVGLALMVVSFFMVDLLTPGKLAHHVFVDHRRDASAVLASSLLATGMIVATAIYTASDNGLEGWLETTAYGALGIGLLGVSFVLLDLLTPGKLGELITDDKDDPAVWVTVTMQLAIGLVVAASLT